MKKNLPLIVRRTRLLTLCKQVDIASDSDTAKIIRNATHAQLDIIEARVMEAFNNLTRAS